MKAENKAVHLTDFLVSLPHPALSAIGLFVLSALFGIANAFLSTSQLSIGLVLDGIGQGIFLLALPGLLTAVLLYLSARRKLPFRQIIFLVLFCSLIYALVYLGGLTLEVQGHQLAQPLVFIGFALIFIIWFLIAKLAFDLGRTALFFALLQLLLYSLFLLASRYVSLGVDPFAVLLKFYFASLVLLLFLYCLFWLINAPMKRRFGISSTDVVEMFLSQWFRSRRDLEEAFQDIGEEVETLVGVVGIKTKTQQIKLIVPYLHFGPFGNLGGSEFSYLIARSLQKDNDEVFVFHGPATHDFNPVSSLELVSVVSACEECIGKMRYKPAQGTIAIGKSGPARSFCLKVNDTALIGLSQAPRTTEDIDFGLGLALTYRAENYVGKALIVDEHNAETGEIVYVEPGSGLSFHYLGALEAGLQQKAKERKLYFAAASNHVDSPSLGDNGLKLLLIKADKLYALIVADTNGIEPGFRRFILDHFAQLGKQRGLEIEAEVFTTDTHQLNRVRGVLNPLGLEDAKVIVPALEGLLNTALPFLSPAEFALEKARFKIKVFGSGQAKEIISTVNAIVAMLKIAAPILLIAGLLTLLWLLLQI